ncbi:U-box domain-containing protein 5-like [Impatiens glandulifera]|uniref:U-box domain-containing protein 5-like n=1 Tax=Impatiens glandulifera TaxID=253017 RepID=UPI001FB12E93|nr:U-box domain-containing protein 5-like [Impatiens glandulifera]
MGSDIAEDKLVMLPSPNDIKVHRVMLTELLRQLVKITIVFPRIEASRPGCSGIQAVTTLSKGIDKAKLLIQYCAESSKLYLALTGDAILQRCKRSRNLLEQSLYQIQNLVPVILAAEISGIISDLRRITFSLDSSEEEAGNILRAFLQQCTSRENSNENSAIETIRLVSLKLRITSQKDVVTERRSIKRLFDKLRDDDKTGKKQILVYLLNLLKNYGQLIIREPDNGILPSEELFSYTNSHNYSTEDDMLSRTAPSEEFKCPMSLRMMYDPVVIASGVTFERFWIQRWFDEGNGTCPKTKMKLDHFSLTPNVTMKDHISSWCMANGVTVPDPSVQSSGNYLSDASFTSVASLTTSLNDLYLPVDTSNVSFGSSDGTDGWGLRSTPQRNLEPQRSQSSSNQEMDEELLANLDALPWDFQCQVVDDLKIQLKRDFRPNRSLSSENFVYQLLEFLKHANDLHDWRALRNGAQLFSSFLKTCRNSSPYFHEDAYELLASLLSSDVIEEGLSIMEVLSQHEYHINKIVSSGSVASVLGPILKILGTDISQFQDQAIGILYNFSLYSEVCSRIVPSEVVSKLVPFFEDTTMARYCTGILKNLSYREDALSCIVETNGCIGFMARVLDYGDREVQENAVSVLLTLCSHRLECSHLVMDEGVIPALVNISVNGNEKGKVKALELLRVLRDIGTSASSENQSQVVVPKQNPNPIPPKDNESSYNNKEKKSSASRSKIFGIRLPIFSKPKKK